VRLYGRYRGGGKAAVTVTADVRGVPLRQSAEMQFPAEDAGNPEIERMWALKRVDRLLKTADRTGTRDGVKSEIIALGETYSIVTEYTSFLVLENDAEYQRWKIARRNAERTGRDRGAQQKREDELAALRQRAASDLGPQPVERRTEMAQASQPPAAPTAPTPGKPGAPAPTAARPGRSVDFNFGTGPVGPLFLVLSAWLSRRRQRRQA
jgi:hypothetical protein